jgi:hypothetical protein
MRCGAAVEDRLLAKFHQCIHFAAPKERACVLHGGRKMLVDEKQNLEPEQIRRKTHKRLDAVNRRINQLSLQRFRLLMAATG